MSFNSYLFLFAFLPAFLLAFTLSRTHLKNSGLMLLLVIAASLVFYTFGSGASLVYLMLSLAVNYALGWRVAAAPPGPRRQTWFLCGLTATIVPLVFYKYKMIADWSLFPEIGRAAMPLAMSFLAFQQVIFLAEMRREKSRCLPILDYLASVLFFPKLISGPLASVQEVAKQMRVRFIERPLAEDMAMGFAYFSFGLFKKVVISDQMQPGVAAVFGGIEAGHGVPFLDAWVGLITFFVMLYFDFSGYSDMAVGLARMCGITLPFNFNSPLKAVSVVDFWARWHITLMKFLLGYIYNPLALWRTRAAMAARRGKWRMFAETAVFPAFATMLVSGVWHGGGWNFIIFGVAHGLALSINQAWRQFKMPHLPLIVAWGLTFGFVSLTLILFRAPDPTAAWLYLQSLLGVFEIRLPLPIARILTEWTSISVEPAVPGSMFSFFVGGAKAVGITLGALILALVLPNTQQVMGEAKMPAWAERWKWQPSPAWAVLTALGAAVSIFGVSANFSTFVYFGF